MVDASRAVRLWLIIAVDALAISPGHNAVVRLQRRPRSPRKRLRSPKCSLKVIWTRKRLISSCDSKWSIELFISVFALNTTQWLGAFPTLYRLASCLFFAGRALITINHTDSLRLIFIRVCCAWKSFIISRSNGVHRSFRRKLFRQRTAKRNCTCMSSMNSTTPDQWRRRKAFFWTNRKTRHLPLPKAVFVWLPGISNWRPVDGFSSGGLF